MSRSEPVPPEVLAIAVALAVSLAEQAGAGQPGDAERREPSPWRWAGRRWERPASYRWS